MDDWRHFYEKYLSLSPFESPFSFRKHSTIGCGGEARIAFFPRTVEEAVSLLSALDDDGIDYIVLGCLSNVLPKDGISDKVVVCTKKLSGFDGDVLAGTTVGAFLKVCKAKGLSGGEFLVGIPCTMGGAAYMNAGVAGAYFSDIVRGLTVYKDGKLHRYTKDDCRYAYKHSIFMEEGGVILSLALNLRPASIEEIEKETARYLSRRKHLPKGRSMGCVFKNPDGRFAGELIEEAGLKGLREGDAFVSDVHANFVINEGNRAEDVRTLIKKVKAQVLQKTGVELEEEIKYLD